VNKVKQVPVLEKKREGKWHVLSEEAFDDYVSVF
jgi:hypothetical protein